MDLNQDVKNFIIFYFDVLIVEDDMILGLKQMLGDYYGIAGVIPIQKKRVSTPPFSLVCFNYICVF